MLFCFSFILILGPQVIKVTYHHSSLYFTGDETDEVLFSNAIHMHLLEEDQLQLRTQYFSDTWQCSWSCTFAYFVTQLDLPYSGV